MPQPTLGLLARRIARLAHGPDPQHFSEPVHPAKPSFSPPSSLLVSSSPTSLPQTSSLELVKTRPLRLRRRGDP